MNILLAFDKFKHAMTAEEACAYTEEVILQTNPDWKVQEAPLSDGGEGFCELLTKQAHGQLVPSPVLGPRLKAVTSHFGLVQGENIPSGILKKLNLTTRNTLGIVEMASASGLAMLAKEELDPKRSTSYGTGQLLEAAAQAGADALILGIGGSATNDLGLGALEALGITFQYSTPHAHVLPEHWDAILEIDVSSLDTLPPLFIACDVKNPLTGPQGATSVYGPQKGLKSLDFDYFETHMQKLAQQLCNLFGKEENLMHAPGSGAAGGIAFALQAAYSATLLPGFQFVAEWINLEEKIKWADIILTGEGRFDPTSLQGKGPGAILALAQKHQTAIELFVGCTSGNVEKMITVPLQSITPRGMTTETALRKGKENIQNAIRNRFSHSHDNSHHSNTHVP